MKPRRLVTRGIVRDGQRRFLLMRRAAGSLTWPLCWEFPGGKVDAGEDVAAALVREFREETGLAIRVGRLCDAFEWERKDDVVLYLVYEVSSDIFNVTVSDEHEEAGWFDLAALAKLNVAEPLKRLVDRLQREAA